MHEVLIVKDPQEFPVAGFDSCLPAGRFVTFYQEKVKK